MTRLIAARMTWTGGAFRPGLAAEIGPEDVLRLRKLACGETPDHKVRLLGPALTDLQVNGSGGVMLNTDPGAGAIAHICATQRARGTGWVMPTLITCEAARMTRAVEAALEARGLPGFLGLHLEGPHINPERRGTHRAEHVRPFETQTLLLVERLRAAGLPVLLTLAPEIVPPEAIRSLAALGVTVSGGHSAASAEETRAALDAGLSCFTHLYNAMPPMTSRDPGIVAAAINSEAFAGLIADGHHVSWEMLALACRARPRAGRMFLVSDAMATIGGPEHFELYAERIALRGGALVNEEGRLAGAHTDLVSSVANMVNHAGLDLETAYTMAAFIPRDAMGLPRPDLVPGTPLDEVLALDEDLRRVAL